LYTRFLAFGDSITEGKIADPPLVISSLGSPLRYLDVDRIRTLANALEPYPLGVQRRLLTKYPSQTFRVVNAGLGGEFVSDGGLARFGGVMAAEQPEVVLLMEGTNDLLSPSGPDAAINALDLMIQQALGQGRRVCLATIPPQRPNGLRNRAAVAARIPPFNDRIRTLAASRQVLLADVYNAMKDDLSLIGIDDLHPTERGYAVIADTFTAAISSQFQQPQPPTPSSSAVW
jgi:lysophospholipase L1-like esterase